MVEDYDYCETKEQENHRKYVKNKLQEIVQTWITQTATALFPDDPEKIAAASATIFPFGSYEIGVHSPGSDIDCLCLTPSYTNRHEHFFGNLFITLSKNSDVTELCKVESCWVPVIKFTFMSIQIDLTFAKLDRESIRGITSKDLLDDKIMEKLDQHS